MPHCVVVRQAEAEARQKAEEAEAAQKEAEAARERDKQAKIEEQRQRELAQLQVLRHAMGFCSNLQRALPGSTWESASVTVLNGCAVQFNAGPMGL